MSDYISRIHLYSFSSKLVYSKLGSNFNRYCVICFRVLPVLLMESVMLAELLTLVETVKYVIQPQVVLLGL